jgi:flagellar motor protein MotB
MKVDLGEVPCSGFASQQFDFPALHAQLGHAARDLLEVMIESAVTAESDPNAGRFCAIVIVGHSDRVDTPGLSSESRRDQELQASELRAESAQAWFFNELFNRLQSQGGTPPVDLSSMQNVDIRTVACGSADLVHKVPSGEQERRENRRVHFIGTVFTP